ncbi:ABC transporter ATP-binding protein [Nocardioides sp. R-N-C8]|nr:ABC transporter ATP-binding protein [Nocardioides nematodiphilus]MCA1981870.1 ABC transporter ATP-binding protein [Nocardioides nematodiphilus]
MIDRDSEQTAGQTARQIAAQAQGLVKVYGNGAASVRALDGVDLAVEAGRFTVVMGASGSGKSTLMHCLAGLEKPTAGTVTVAGESLGSLSDKRLTMLRRDRVGFVFQAFNLIPTLTARENILLPLSLAGRRPDPAWWDLIIGRLRLEDRLDHRPGQLSGGQQQRVACARALLGRPTIIFADEPTGNLDSRSSGEIMTLLRSSVDDFGQTVVMVTHDPVGASYSDRVVFLADGRIVEDATDVTVADILSRLARLQPATAETGGS